ncbi:MAG TPA: MYXO-CTERM sorting domain-containing protein [Polyangiaceae bacterium]|nr:MYXO-CTERM sorting domain-containing protein [Polyangiaceae bacterium]
MRRRRLLPLALASLFLAGRAAAQTVTLDVASPAQTIDGFGTCLSGTEGQSAWWQSLYFDDLGASMLRMDLVPHFKSPYSDRTYDSPWFHDDPALPGPENNNVRTYTSASDYGRTFAGHNAPIAVMGPDIDQNVLLFDFADDGPKTAGAVAQAGLAKKAALGDFKLFGSMWSPAPWLKITSGGTISGQSGILPVNGTPWPFIWGGNFSGGKLDTSGTARAEFDDSSIGGSGPTSALTQFARGLAAYLRGFQQKYGVSLYSISIQNELNFETFYNSCTYPLSDGYIKAVLAARAELDRYDDLRGIRIMGPEDLLGGDGYGMWQYGGGSSTTHKNLQYLQNIDADSQAASAIDFFCIHGYAPDGVSSAGSNPVQWQWWADGWSTSPGAGIPANVKGFSSYGKKSWMTETSGENTAWRAPASGYPGQGAFSIAVKIHQALTVGRESAWAYWQLSDGSTVGDQTLTDATARETSPKYVAVKHFFKYIRPNSVRVPATVGSGTSLLASAYVNDAAGTLTVVLVNTSASDATATLAVPARPANVTSFDVHTSKDGSLWQPSTADVASGSASIPVPGYGVVTAVGTGDPTPGSGGTGGATGTGGTSSGGATSNGGTSNGGTSNGDGGVVPGDGGATSAGGATTSSGGTAPNGGASSGGASNGGASGASTTGGASAQGGTNDGAPTAGSNDSSGCGCRMAPAPSEHGLVGALLGLAALTRRRRRGSA